MSYARHCWMLGCGKQFLTDNLNANYCPQCIKLTIENKEKTYYSDRTEINPKQKES